LYSQQEINMHERLGSHAHAGTRLQQQQSTWVQRTLRALGWSRQYRVQHHHSSALQEVWADQGHGGSSGSPAGGSPWWQAAGQYHAHSSTKAGAVQDRSTDPEAACTVSRDQGQSSSTWRLPAQAVGEAATDAGARVVQGTALDPFQVRVRVRAMAGIAGTWNMHSHQHTMTRYSYCPCGTGPQLGVHLADTLRGRGGRRRGGAAAQVHRGCTRPSCGMLQHILSLCVWVHPS
jgi:hypothetical protein